jgi:hypothetical protein
VTAHDLYHDLTRRGIRLVDDGGVLRWQAPPGALTVADVKRIKEMKEGLLAVIPGRSADPRPDLTGDSALWTRLLRDASARDGADPHGAFAVLHGLRCLGCRLVRDGRSGVRIDRGEEIGDTDYRTFKFVYLIPRKDAITALLAGLTTEREGVGPTQAA